MNGRILTEEEQRITRIRTQLETSEKIFKETQSPEYGWYLMDVKYLLEQLDAEHENNEHLRGRLNALSESNAKNYIKGYKELEQQNTILREALEAIERGLFSTRHADVVAREALAKVGESK